MAAITTITTVTEPGRGHRLHTGLVIHIVSIRRPANFHSIWLRMYHFVARRTFRHHAAPLRRPVEPAQTRSLDAIEDIQMIPMQRGSRYAKAAVSMPDV